MDPEDDNVETGHSDASSMDDVPESYMTEKMDETVFEDDKSEKVFKLVSSPDSVPISDEGVEIPPMTIVTDVHDAEDPHTPHNGRHSHFSVKSRLDSPYSPTADEHIISPDTAVTSSPGALFPVSLGSHYTSSAKHAQFPASGGGPMAYPQSPLGVPGQAMPKSPLSPLPRSPSRSAALRSNLGMS